MHRDSLPPDAHSLLQMSQAGDEDAWGRLLNAFRSKLYSYAQRALPPAVRTRESASDIVQQTLADAFRARDQFQGDDPSKVAPWLFGILKNRMREALRRHNRFGRRDVAREVSLSFLSDSDIPATDAPTVNHTGSERIAVLLDELGETERELLRWRLEEDLTFAEIAERLGVSEDAARQRHSRLILELRRRVQAQSGEDSTLE